MNITIEIENKEDFPFIKKLMENLKGVKILPTESENIEEVEMPDEFFEALENYADNLKDEDCISEEEFFKNARQKVCELYSQK